MANLIEDFLREKKANGVKESTVINIRKALNRLDKYKSIDTCTRQDLRLYFASMDVGERTKNTYKVCVKNYFTWKDEADKVEWIQIKRIKSSLNEEDLITPDEVTKILTFCELPRDSALISLLSESGCRISEALNLNLGDLIKTDYGYRMHVRKGKTGDRDISLINSVPYITQWLNVHPLRTNMNAPLFIGFGTRSHMQRLTAGGARRMLKRTLLKAGITKRIHPHLFRHTQLTNFAQSGMQESILRKLAGWSARSNMPEIYIHVGNKDVEEAQLALHGRAVAHKKILDNPLSKECPQCHKMIPVDAQFCENCSKHQDLSHIVRRSLEENESLKNRVADLEAGKELVSNFIKLVKNNPESMNKLKF